jgi:hypothetical protein
MRTTVRIKDPHFNNMPNGVNTCAIALKLVATRLPAAAGHPSFPVSIDAGAAG